MEAMVIHSSPTITTSALYSPSPRKRNDKNSETSNNNKPRRKQKRSRSSVSPTVEGNGRIRRNLPSETESDSGSAGGTKSTSRPIAPARKSKFTAVDTVQKRLKGLTSDSNSDAQDALKTPKVKQSARSSSLRLSLSPDPIDGLDERSSPPPLSTLDPNTNPSQSDEDTPRPKQKRRERSPKAHVSQGRTDPKDSISKARSEQSRPQTAQPKARALSRVDSTGSTSSFFGNSPRAPRRSTVSTSVVRRPMPNGGARRQRRAESDENDSTSDAGQRRPRAQQVKPQPSPRKSSPKKSTPRKSTARPSVADRFSDDESELSAGGPRKAKGGKLSKRDKDGARYLDTAVTSKPDPKLKAEVGKIKAKLQSEERLAVARFEEEDRERAASWRGVEDSNRQGESFFASATTVDIAETEERIARAQAAIEAKPVSLSQETHDGAGEESRYCAQFCNYDDLCDICFGPLPKDPSRDLLKLRKKLKRGAHKTQGITFCTMHRAETHTLPLGWRQGYPKELDFATVDSRLEEDFIRDRISRVVHRPTCSKFFRRAERRIEQLGLTRWQSLTAQSSDEVLSTATPGYYGDLGRAIIIHHFQHLVKWKLLTIRPDDIQPLSPADFIIHVLVPETAILLIMQDQGWNGQDATDKAAASEARARAMDTHRQSGEYGRAAFREESVQGREVLGHLEATLEQKRKRLERRARDEANIHGSQVIELLSSDTVDPSSDYGDDHAWLNDAYEAYETYDDPKEATPRPRLPSTKLSRTAVHASSSR